MRGHTSKKEVPVVSLAFWSASSLPIIPTCPGIHASDIFLRSLSSLIIWLITGCDVFIWFMLIRLLNELDIIRYFLLLV